MFFVRLFWWNKMFRNGVLFFLIYVVSILFVSDFSYAVGLFKDTSNIHHITSDFAHLLSHIIYSILYYKILGIPAIILWVIVSSIFFSVRLKLVQFRLFGHSIDVIRGKYTKGDEPGLFTHAEAVLTAALGTVGLGSVAGVGIAVISGGPGSVVWIVIIGIFSMSIKFCEIVLGHKYRVIKGDKVYGGPFLYILEGLKELGLPKCGVVIGKIYALAIFGNALFAANMFQTNQSMLILVEDIKFLQDYRILLGCIFVVVVAVPVLSGAKFIAKLSEKIVPLMAIAYYICCIIIIVVFRENLVGCVKEMFVAAFDPNAFKGGIIGALVAAATRVVYSTEAGGGTSGISHAASKTREPVREGCTAFIELLFPLLVCILTGIIIVITKSNVNFEVGGILVTQGAFKAVSPKFEYVLTVLVPVLALTTAIAWGFYGQHAWKFVFGDNKSIILFYIIFFCATFSGTVIDDTQLIIEFGDYVWLFITIPNIAVLYLLNKMLYEDTEKYIANVRDNKFPVYR